MKFFNLGNKTYKIKLKRDLTKHLKRGNPWVFSDAVEKINAPEGALTQLLDKNQDVIATGIYSPSINLAFRAITLGFQKITDQLIEQRLLRAFNQRSHLIDSNNQCARIINGEGDELPGIVADYYQGVLVLKLDGAAPEAFWNKEELASFFMNQKVITVACVYYKRKNNEADKGEILAGKAMDLTNAQFIENGVKFQSNIVDAAKTGFFLDQRENRNFIKSFSKDKTLLNLFGYTGGFSVYAGLGGAKQVTTVDIAPQAIEASKINWKINNLSSNHHEAICDDAFKWIQDAQKEKKTWDIVITDPPSFAPNQKSVESAKEAYIKVFSDSLKLVKDDGFFAASSCSGHIGFELFLEIVQESLSKAKKRGRVLLIKGQPEDHPYPLALSEMRYLKFVFLQVFK
jgi:23S rRNA (cytosine1962-C5)-methyltransferase